MRTVAVADIDADAGQPREDFDPAAIRALRDSIARNGLIQPLICEGRPGGGGGGDGRYRVIAGERRLRALKLGAAEEPDNPRFATAPAIVYPPGTLSTTQVRAWQLAENLQRHDLSPGEIARGLRAVRDALALAEAGRLAAAYGVLPDQGGEGGAAPDEGRRVTVLRAALKRARLPWPEPSWPNVLAAVGLDLSGGAYNRVLRILGLSDPVLDRCTTLGLTRNAAAAVGAVPGAERQWALLDAAAAAGDPSLATPAAELLAADPGLEPRAAVASILASRRAAGAGRDRGAGGDDGQLTLPKPPCPAEEFDRLAGALRAADGILRTFRLDPYQVGSVRLLLERLGAATGGAACEAESGKAMTEEGS